MISFKQLFYERKGDERFIKMANQLYLSILRSIKNTDGGDFIILLSSQNDKFVGIGIDVSKINPKYRFNIYVKTDKDKGSSAHYDYVSKDIVINTRVISKNKEWLRIQDENEFYNYFVKNLSYFLPRTHVIYEIIHYFDDNYNDKSYENIGSDSDYFNSFKEINAYLISSLHDYRNDMKRGRYETFEKFKDSFIDYTFDINWKLITDENKKRIIKRMYNFWKKRINNSK